MKKYLLIAIGVLFIMCCSLFAYVDKQHKENKRLEANQEALLTQNEEYKTLSGKSAISAQQLELTKAELEKENASLILTVSDLELKLKRVQSIAGTGTETKLIVQTVIKDSIVYVDKMPETLQTFNWKDPWIDVSGKIKDKKVDLNITSKDTIVQVLHRIPKKFLFIKYGTKKIQQEVTCSNPHTNIVYSEYIKMK